MQFCFFVEMILPANHCLREAESEKKNVSGMCVILNLVFAVIFANFINHILKEKYDTERCC